MINISNLLIALVTNLLLLITLTLLSFKLLTLWLRVQENHFQTTFFGLIILSAIAPIVILSSSANSALMTMLDVEMQGNIEKLRLAEFLGIYGASITLSTLFILLIVYLLWRVLLSNGKKLKLHLDDNSVASGIFILGTTIGMTVVLSDLLRLFIEGMIHFPVTPLFR